MAFIRTLLVIFVFTTSVASGLSEQGEGVFFNPVLWLSSPLGDYIRSEDFRSQRFDNSQILVETRASGEEYYIRNRLDFISHMFDAYPNVKKLSKGSVERNLSKLYKKNRKDVGAYIKAFQILYQTKKLSVTEKINWVETRFEKLPVPFLLYLSVLYGERGDVVSTMKWRIVALKALEYDIMMCEDGGVDTARGVLRAWWLKEMFERCLLRDEEALYNISEGFFFYEQKKGVRIYKDFYNLDPGSDKVYFKTMSQWAANWVAQITGERKAQIVEALNEISKNKSISSRKQISSKRPYWLVYHGLGALYEDVSDSSFQDLMAD